MSAVLFGSIGTIADTSELQRQAFNRAFETHGLDWHWSQEDYRRLLSTSGGEQRVAAYADGRGETVDAAAVHRTKSEAFQELLSQRAVQPRDGVVETVQQARDEGVKVALVTTTSPDNVASLLDALAGTLDRSAFDLVVDASTVGQPKPADAAYRYALDTLGESADDCVAIEDNVGGVQAAGAAGIECIAFPGENNADHDFGPVAQRVDRLAFVELRALIEGA